MDNNLTQSLATALFRLAGSPQERDTLEQELLGIGGLFASDRKIRLFLLHPHIPSAKKQEFIAVLASGILPRKLLNILCSVKKPELVRDVAASFSQLKRVHENRISAEVKLPVKPGPGEEAAIVEALKRFTGKNVDARITIEPGLLGGIWMKVDGQVVDHTIKAMLRGYRENLL